MIIVATRPIYPGLIFIDILKDPYYLPKELKFLDATLSQGGALQSDINISSIQNTSGDKRSCCCPQPWQWPSCCSCSCPRCQDPAECGTLCSALRCPSPGCPGPVLPGVCPTTAANGPPWSCVKCGAQVNKIHEAKLIFYHTELGSVGRMMNNFLESGKSI